MTSRSPRYYVSAAYWDRDSLLWAFPAILTADAVYAREILIYVFTRQAVYAHCGTCAARPWTTAWPAKA